MFTKYKHFDASCLRKNGILWKNYFYLKQKKDLKESITKITLLWKVIPSRIALLLLSIAM